MDIAVLRKKMAWTFKHYGSDAMEKKNPGSKLESQINHICEFIRQYREAEDLLCDLGFDLVRIEPSHL